MALDMWRSLQDLRVILRLRIQILNLKVKHNDYKER